MIRVFAPDATTFDTLGLAVLHPTVCTVRQVTGGEYSLSLTHPITADGVWRYLTDFAIIKAPIPPESIPSITVADNEYDADAVTIYTAKEGAKRYSNTGASKRITYAAWQSQHYYSAGDKVTYGGQNYQATSGHMSGNSFSQQAAIWATISNYTTTAPTVAGTTAAGTLVYQSKLISSVWLQGVDANGNSGYWKLSDLEYLRTERKSAIDGDIAAQEIDEQVFRITNIDRDSSAKTVKVEAVQLTYDYSASTLTDGCNFDAATLPNVVQAMRTYGRGGNSANESKPFIACEAFEETYTGDLSRQSIIHAILDPDEGIVSKLHAKLVRDEKNFYIIHNEEVNRGFKISYGGNMKGVQWTRDTSKLVTRIYPYGKDASGNTLIYDDGDGGETVDSTRIDEFPIIYAESLDTGLQIGQDHEGTAVTADNIMELMREAALKRFNSDFADVIEETIDVDFVLLGDSEEYRQYRNLQRVSIYDFVTVIHDPLGLMATAQVKEYEYDSIRRRFNKITLGNIWTYGMRTVAGYDIGDGVIRYKKLSADAINKIVEEARNG